jgi:C_GCAxxG_C_C family probable redox protein
MLNDNVDAREITGKYFKNGYNCAEAVLRSFCDTLNLPINEEALKIASGFGGGVGHAGCMCGALTGATMIISLLTGRTSPDQSREPAYQSAAEFHKRFTDEFGAACCRVINLHPFATPEQRRNCLKITGKTAELLQAFLQERNLLNTKNAG